MTQPRWPDCIDDGYFVKGCLNTGYVVRERMEEMANQMANGGLTTTQVRRFFQHCRAIEARLREQPTTWDSERVEFMKLDAFAADGLARKKIPRNFHDFISRHVAAVKTKEDFLNGFLPHFEALVGFGSAYFKK